MDSSPQTDRSIVKTDPVHNYSPAMDQTWLMTGLELPTSQLRLFLCGLGLSSKGNLETLHDRLIRHLEYKYEVPGVHWDPTVDEVSPPGDDLESTLLPEKSEIGETGKLTEIVVDINQTSQSSIQSSCEDLIERVDEILSSSSRLIQELASSGGFSKHESFESLDVTPQRELVTYPSISEEEVLNSDGSYSAHKDELVNDPSSTVDGVVLDHASKTAGPPMDNDGESVNFESSMDQIVTRRDLDVAVRKLESKIENCFTQLQQVIMDKMMTRVNYQEDTSRVVNDQKLESQSDSGVDCESKVPSRDSAPLKDSDNRVFRRRRRRYCNDLKKPSDGTIISDEAVHNLTSEYTKGEDASRKASSSTVNSDPSDQKDGSSDAKSEVAKKRKRRRRRRSSKKTETSRAPVVVSNVVDFSQRPVYDRYVHSKVNPRRYVPENRFEIRYELANRCVGPRWEVPCAAKYIREDIRGIFPDNENYPSSKSLLSTDKIDEVVPNSLTTLLSNIILPRKKGCTSKLCSCIKSGLCCSDLCKQCIDICVNKPRIASDWDSINDDENVVTGNFVSPRIAETSEDNSSMDEAIPGPSYL
ncbi:hypothetical protein KQX54_011664 [Cotesia glomerata]|uniref:Uncharacterized protein n=1 Tax=Cotesia glomerata TaxID=32391 RepID=A0AAV7IYA6_COTGL|nr:hypothetical protein KQX54_011664 [Cotesia glomerata]